MEININSLWKDVYGNYVRVIDILSTFSLREGRNIKEVYYCSYISFLGSSAIVVNKEYFSKCVQTTPQLEEEKAKLERLLNEDIQKERH